MAVPPYESSSSNTSGNNSVTVTKPSGVAAGDLLLAFLVTNSTNASTFGTLPSGWSVRWQNAFQAGGADDGFIGVAYKLAGASEPADYTFQDNSGNANRSVGAIVRVSGVHASAYLDAYAQSSAFENNASPSSPSATTTGPDRRVIVFHGGHTGGSGRTVPSGTTSILEVNFGSGGGSHIILAHFSQVSAGATGAKTWGGLSADDGYAYTIAIAPPSGGGTTESISSASITATAPAATPDLQVSAPSASATPSAPAAAPALAIACPTATATASAPACGAGISAPIQSAESTTSAPAATPALSVPLDSAEVTTSAPAASASVGGNVQPINSASITATAPATTPGLSVGSGVATVAASAPASSPNLAVAVSSAQMVASSPAADKRMAAMVQAATLAASAPVAGKALVVPISSAVVTASAPAAAGTLPSTAQPVGGWSRTSGRVIKGQSGRVWKRTSGRVWG